MTDILPTSLPTPSYPSKVAEQIAHSLFQAQQQLILALETLDGNTFTQDPWQREQGGGGISCVMEQGRIFEKGAVLFSSITGKKLPPAALTSKGANPLQTLELPFFATGLSLILHPSNPYVPAVHLNVRYFETGAPPPTLAGKVSTSKDSEINWWFGGGMDLTPCYPFEQDCIEFHQAARAACHQFDAEWHARFKAWCDQYFYLPHRKEMRGVGGIFFNQLCPASQQLGSAFLQAIIESFLCAYPAIVKRRQNMTYGKKERNFLLYRRGRYVEFNLLYDQGTLFGLQSGGRVESILMSMPPAVSWLYNWKPKLNSPEERLIKHFLVPQDWANAPLDPMILVEKSHIC